MGDSARPVIAEALEALGIETRVGVQLISVDRNGARFSTGEVVPAATVVWCAGMQAHPLTAQFPAERDRFGRLRTDSFLKINGLDAEFAAGDVATFPVDGSHDFGDVLSARAADGPVRWAQRGLRPAGPAYVAAPHRLVHHDS